MKKAQSLMLFVILGASACGKASDANSKNFTKSVNAYLAVRGDFCLGKPVWPIDVTVGEFQGRSRNALQMPALERIGLVISTDAVAEQQTEDGVISRNVKRYDLTAEGRRYYLTRANSGARSGSSAASDFCVGKLSLDEVVGWEKIEEVGGRSHTVVTYSYRMDAPTWAQNPEIKAVFPVLAAVAQGAGKAQLKEPFTLFHGRWLADDLVVDAPDPHGPVQGPLVKAP